MRRQLAQVLVCIALCLLTVWGQTTGRHMPRSPNEREGADEQWGPESTVPPDMKSRMATERAESEHRKVLDSVEKLSELSSDVARHYREKGSLSDDDFKKLGSIEKLAKQVLSHSLGDQVEDDATVPETVGEAVDQLKAAAENIKKKMSAETRFAVSASVIASSNEVITLARFIKRASNKD